VRYFFDLRDADGLFSDEVGVELPTLGAAQEEAALSLAGMARDAARKVDTNGTRAMAIEVRDESGLLLEITFRIEVKRIAASVESA
jgi:hypothetical protein